SLRSHYNTFIRRSLGLRIRSDLVKKRRCGKWTWVAWHTYEPLPRIDSRTQSGQIHRTDLKSAYHQVPLHPRDKPFTAFEAAGGLYQFTRVPFGVTNGIAYFQRTIDLFIKDEHLEGAFAYVDDITVCGSTQADHDRNLENFLKTAQRWNFTLNKDKCTFSTRKLRILGPCGTLLYRKIRNHCSERWAYSHTTPSGCLIILLRRNVGNIAPSIRNTDSYNHFRTLSNPLCLICEKTFANEVMKPSKLIKHLNRMHGDKAGKDLSYFQSLRDNFKNRKRLPTILSSASSQSSDRLRASYNLSLMIAKSGKPHTISEQLLLPAVSEVLRTMLHMPATNIIKKIPLSNNTEQRRIGEMGANIESTLWEFLKTAQFSLQLDESVLPQNEALLLAYVQFIKGEKLEQELLFAREMIADTKGECVFYTVQGFFQEKGIPLTNIMSVAPDGALSMVGCHRGFISYLKRSVPNVLAVHCVIRRQHLVAKRLSARLYLSLQYVILAINKIKKNPLKGRLFSQLCDENDEEFNRLLLHTEFFESEDVKLGNNLKKRRGDIAYLSDLYFKFNEMNLQLQGDDLNLIKTKNVISAFVSKLLLFKQNLARGGFYQFPNLCGLKKTDSILDDDVHVYCDHLNMLHKEMHERYEDILTVTIPPWILDPYSNANEIETFLQEELIELQANEELKPRFKSGYSHFWLQYQIAALYPELWKVVKKFLVPFPSSYLVWLNVGSLPQQISWLRKETGSTSSVRPLVQTTAFSLSAEVESAFPLLKRGTEKSSVRAVDESLPFEVETDASEVALAAVLNQLGRPAAQPSADAPYSCVKDERRCRKKKPKQSLKQCDTGNTDRKTFHDKNGPQFDFDIIYRPREDNVPPDVSSRIACGLVAYGRSHLKLLHEGLCHLGVTRLQHFVRPKNLPYLLDEIRQVTSGCRVCAECKPSFYSREKAPLTKATQPFERLNLDFKGPLPGDSASRFLLCVIPFAFPCPDTSSASVTKALTELFCLFSVPAYIHSDRGTAFMRSELRDFLLKQRHSLQQNHSLQP
ncbi:hypothetical protein M514_12069, partial [Trichuris suis]